MEIKGLSVEQLVDYINKELQKDEKLGINKLCDREGLKNSTVKSRLNRNGYKYNSEERKYYKITNSNSKSNTNNDTNSIAKINTKKKIKNDNSIEKIKDEKDTKDNTNIITNDILLDLMQNIKRLENRLDKIEKNTKDNTKVITKRNIKNNIGYMNIKNTKDTTTKSIRLYTEVKAELDKYIEEHKEVKVIDIVSFAILEYINKNK
ncbi:hypothetical protein OEG88_14195 (plasmid) [Clostridium perfringens]|uniref:hypothetical protein n=1 Tax=Clostridium perfringens TaxID=1502 RepID=UPI001A1D6C12|nr:hypothetical protein [Clostridium perfringens]MDK0613238.1 hypothetical protein [Clostridium perfringens]MDK0645790.1 hypothetical protein [Clostridium perfringens]MDM0627695.1 hypothetical protein [Clostridium perfringens]MDM0642664.1 hypothetical protein [Clostridium perfringens]UBK70124.1 hypothetical protein KLF38_13790 [Clostridium perfringens]